MSKKETTNKVIDLNSLDSGALANQGAPMTVSNPQDGLDLIGTDGKPWVVQVLGQDSDKWRQKNYDLLNKRLSNPKLRVMAPRADVIEAENIERLAISIVGWSENYVLGGEVLRFSDDNVRMMLTRFPWFRDQVIVFQENINNFLPK